jgi:hypothetical protein
MGKAVRPKTSQSLPSMGSRGRQRGRVRRRILIFVVILVALASAGVWWGMSQLQSTDNRSQASVNQSFRLRVVPQSGEPAGWDLVLSARSAQAVVQKVRGFVQYSTGSVDRSVSAAAPTTTDRRVLESADWIITTALPETASFFFTENDGRLEFSLDAPEGVLSGEPVLFTMWSRFGVAEPDRSLWLLNQPSIRGFLQSNRGIELELLSKEQKNPTPTTTQCVSTVRRCPKLSAVTTTDQYPCGACLDKNGKVVGPIPPSPLPLAP